MYTLAKNDHSINFHSSVNNLLHIYFFLADHVWRRCVIILIIIN